MTTARIRRATPDDAAALAALDARCFDAGWDEGAIWNLLDTTLTLGWCLHVEGTLVAAVLVRTVVGEGEILRLAVEPGYRRQGLARALMQEVMADLTPALPFGLHLEVRASNTAARRLYARLGFEETGRRRAYYTGPDEDAVLMRWDASARPSGSGAHA